MLDDDRLSIKPSLRVERYGGTSEVVVDPRLNLQEQLTPELSLRAAAGRYHQPPAPADLDPVNGNPALESSYYDQASLGVDGSFGATTASITGFYEYGHDLGVIEPTATNQYMPDLGGLGPTFQLLLERQLGFSYYRENVGSGRNDGIELLVKRKVGRWFGLVSYTLAQAQRTDDPRLTLTGPYPYLWRPFELDQRHNFNAAGSVVLGAWRLGARVQIVSGDPYSPSYIDAQGNVVQIPFGGRLPTFYQIDVRADRMWKRRRWDIDLYFDIQNVTDHINVEDYSFDPSMGPHGAETVVPGLPILPFIGVAFVPK
jgi:outer membrane cobalamin receptor